MRITIDCTHYFVPGGIRAYIGNLVPALATVAPRDEYILYVRGREPQEEALPVPEGTHSRWVRERWPRRAIDFSQNLLGYPRADWWCGPHDVFHGMHFHVPPTRSALKVLTLHDLAYLKHPELYANKKLNDYGYRYLLSHSLRRVDQVIVSSHSTQSDLESLHRFDAQKIWVVHFGADPRFRRAAQREVEELRARLGLAHPYVVYPAGTLDKRKNIANVIRAFALAFPRRGERPLLVVTGLGAPPAELESAAREAGLEGDWRTIRAAGTEEMASLLSGAEWGIYLSLYEGFGVPVLEMMACGVPMLVSNRSSMPEVAGAAALLAEPGNLESMAAAMRELQRSAQLRAELSRRGLERAQSAYWSWERAARQVRAVYDADRAAFNALAEPPNASELAAAARAN